MDVDFFIEQYLQEVLSRDEFNDHFLLEVRSTGSKYEVFLDGDKGVTIDMCRKVSRMLEEELESKGIVDAKYTLEVSSPGADRPLTIPRQYGKHVGRKLAVTLKDGSVVQGTMTEMHADGLRLTEKQKKGTVERDIPFADIKESVVQISFN